METKTIKATMHFPVGTITKPLTYHLVKKFDLEINILRADISLEKVGKLTADISGTEENIQAGLKYLEDEGISYRLFTKSIIWQADSCIHCGACTAVCPSGALEMNETTDWSLTFNSEKCLVCELCVSACPLKIINVSL